MNEIFLLKGKFLRVLTRDRRLARHLYLAKLFCFLDADCLVVGEARADLDDVHHV